MSAVASGASSPVSTAISIVALAVVLSWVLLFVLMLGLNAAIILARKASRRSAAAAAGSGARPAPRPPALQLGTAEAPAGLDALRRADPHFDDQLLIDAAQTAALLMFVALSTGDEGPISRVATETFWRSRQGRLVHTVARDRRTSNEFAARDGGSRSRQQMVIVDYQASAAGLTAVRLGSEQEVCVRVTYGQLTALVRPSAEALAATASARSLTAGLISLGQAVATEASDQKQDMVSWVGGDGHYELTFVRPAGARTDPAAALAGRTCTTCGATYQSELATASQHCGAARPLPFGQWRLASVAPGR